MTFPLSPHRGPSYAPPLQCPNLGERAGIGGAPRRFSVLLPPVPNPPLVEPAPFHREAAAAEGIVDVLMHLPGSSAAHRASLVVSAAGAAHALHHALQEAERVHQERGVHIERARVCEVTAAVAEEGVKAIGNGLLAEGVKRYIPVVVANPALLPTVPLLGQALVPTFEAVGAAGYVAGNLAREGCYSLLYQAHHVGRE
jgi:hypothetical protein